MVILNISVRHVYHEECIVIGLKLVTKLLGRITVRYLTDNKLLDRTIFLFVKLIKMILRVKGPINFRVPLHCQYSLSNMICDNIPL